MNTALSALDLHFMIKELSFIKNAKIMKIFQHDVHKGLFCFQLHAPGKGKILLNVILPSLLYRAQYKFSFPQLPPGFCMFLRKYIGNARIRKIRQVGFERIVEFVIETLEEKFILIVELFSSGNIILCHEDYKIKGLLHSQKWDARTIRGGVTYEFPPQKVNLFSLTQEMLSTMLKTSTHETLVTFCAAELSLGGFYAEKLIADLELDKVAEPKSVNAQILFSGLQKLLSQKPFPCKNNDGIFPIMIANSQPLESFSFGIDELYADKFERETFAQEKAAHKKVTSKYDKRLEEQQAQIDRAKVEIDINSQRGDLIYAHYTDVQSFLSELKELRKTLSWDEIKEHYKDHAFVRTIDEHTGKVTLDFD